MTEKKGPSNHLSGLFWTGLLFPNGWNGKNVRTWAGINQAWSVRFLHEISRTFVLIFRQHNARQFESQRNMHHFNIGDSLSHQSDTVVLKLQANKSTAKTIGCRYTRICIAVSGADLARNVSSQKCTTQTQEWLCVDSTWKVKPPKLLETDKYLKAEGCWEKMGKYFTLGVVLGGVFNWHWARTFLHPKVLFKKDLCDLKVFRFCNILLLFYSL